MLLMDSTLIWSKEQKEKPEKTSPWLKLLQPRKS